MRGGDGGQRLRHGGGDGFHTALGVYAHHGGDALGHGLAGDDHHLLFRQSLTLLSGHDDIAVVGQYEHGLGGDLIDSDQNALRGGIHGLSAGNNGVTAKVAENGSQTVTGADG